jgi:nitrogen fixation-related uncharacterized protein
MSSLPGTSNRSAIIALAVALALLAVGVGGYFWGSRSGYDEAAAKGRAEISALRSEYAEASANASMAALAKYEAQTSAANRVAGELATTRAALAKSDAALKRSIDHAVAAVPADCVFGPDFVGLCNEAFYGVRADAAAQADDSGGTAEGAAKAGAAGAGLRRDASVADLAVWLRAMGGYTRDLEATSAARLTLLKEWAR